MKYISVTLLVILNYWMISLFINGHYFAYFIFLAISLSASIHFAGNLSVVTPFAILLSSFFYNYFDDAVFDLYLYFNLESLYFYFGGIVAIILVFTHAIFLFVLNVIKNRLQFGKII